MGAASLNYLSRTLFLPDSTLPAHQNDTQRDLALLARIREGDEGAFNQLFELYFAQLSRYATAITHQSAAATDLVQDVFYALWAKRKDAGARTTVAAYLYTAVRTTAYNTLRRSSLADRVDAMQDERFAQNIGDDAIAAVQAANWEEPGEKIRDALSRMMAQRREVLLLRWMAQMSYPEIAEVFSAPARTVENTHTRALADFGKLMAAPVAPVVPVIPKVPDLDVEAAGTDTVADEAPPAQPVVDDSKPDVDTFDRYINGTTTLADKTELSIWTRNHPGAPAEIEAVRNGGYTDVQLDEEWNTSTYWGALRARIFPPEVAVTKKRRFAPARMGRAIRTSGPWLLSLVLAGLVFFIGMKVVPKQNKDVEKVRVYETPRGDRATISLPDGTVAVLGPSTRLRVKDDVVELSGEAYFTAKHRPNRPLIVKTGSVETRVIGTIFGVRRFPEDTLTTVAVSEGRVSVRVASVQANTVGMRPIVVNQDNILVATERGATPAILDAVRVADFLAFAQGKIVFDHQTLGSAAVTLARWFDVDIRVDPDVALRSFSATLREHHSSDAFDIVASLTKTTYVKTDSLVIFSALPIGDSTSLKTTK